MAKKIAIHEWCMAWIRYFFMSFPKIKWSIEQEQKYYLELMLFADFVWKPYYSKSFGLRGLGGGNWVFGYWLCFGFSYKWWSISKKSNTRKYSDQENK